MLKKILIIEDEKALVKNLELALSDSYKIITADTGKEGLKKAKKEKPDLILLDVMLPDTTGFEILPELKKDKVLELIPVIVLTNLGDAQTVSNILAAGGKEYLIKSDWSIDEIVKKIKNTLS
ncbi:MAG: response regulator [Candidatus Buchananbacteria bacterium]